MPKLPTAEAYNIIHSISHTYGKKVREKERIETFHIACVFYKPQNRATLFFSPTTSVAVSKIEKSRFFPSHM